MLEQFRRDHSQTTTPGDNAGYFPDIKSAKAYLDGSAGSNTSADYHRDRMRALRLLVEAAKIAPGAKGLDFGCGNGLYFKEFFQPRSISKIVGVDISASMIELASETLRGFQNCAPHVFRPRNLNEALSRP